MEICDQYHAKCDCCHSKYVNKEHYINFSYCKEHSSNLMRGLDQVITQCFASRNEWIKNGYFIVDDYI